MNCQESRFTSCIVDEIFVGFVALIYLNQFMFGELVNKHDVNINRICDSNKFSEKMEVYFCLIELTKPQINDRKKKFESL